MQKLPKMVPIAILCCFAISIYLKHPTLNLEENSGDSLQPFNQKMAQQNLIYRETIKPVNRGQFDIQIFDNVMCKGLLALIALEKNEEGAALLAHYLKQPLSSIRFVFDGKVYTEFPAFTYWVKNLGIQSGGGSVYAIKEYGFCDIIENTDWSQI